MYMKYNTEYRSFITKDNPEKKAIAWNVDVKAGFLFLAGNR